MPKPEFDCLCSSHNNVIHSPILLSCRKYAVSESLENLCRDVVDDYVDTLADSQQLLDCRELASKLVFSILGIALYGRKYVHALIRLLLRCDDGALYKANHATKFQIQPRDSVFYDGIHTAG